ncbi:non-ribosomal peptide synthetase [Saccharopolyspora shandongensis]|uniref:non-ribosomal peptide synthetase n=1 Tax=Saccharopolyspora shandongensis TaxID=418495 RepID=UPI0033CEA917
MTEELAEKKRELLRLMLAERGFGAPDDPRERVPKRTGGGPAALSPAQRRMWLLHKLDPGGSGYNLCGALHCQGELDLAALRQSIQNLLRRNEILRTVYQEDAAGEPAQVVLPDAVAELPVTRPSDGADPDELIGAWAREPFDLAHQIPIRTRLLRLGEHEHLLVVVVHHIAFDDDSWALVMGEIAAGYAGVLPEPADALQYADFAEWRSSRPDSPDGPEFAYWRKQLEPLPQPLALPFDHARPELPGNAGLRRSTRLPAELSAELRATAKRLGTTLNMLLLTVVKAVLHRYSGATDIAIGSPVVHRDRAELEEVVGNFGNTVVLRTDLADDPTFAELADRVRAVCTDAYAHQDLPFDRLVEWLRPPRVAGRNPLFDVMFSFVGSEPIRVERPGVVFAERPVFTGTARFDLVVEAVDAADGLTLSVTAAAELFTPDTADRILGHLRTLAAAAVADPGRRLSELPLLTAGERHRTLREWCGDRTESEVDVPLHRLVERQVQRTPDATAVVFGATRISYAELNARANRLARHLRERGVGPERTVGVHLERSAEMIVGLLAVLKAGGAFVPLEPSWPQHRVDAVARSAKLHAVLARSDGKELQAPAVWVDDDYSDYGSEDLETAPHQESAAYVIFTSGSTGAPKGAVIRHQAIANRLPWQVGLLGLAGTDAVLHKAPLGFDISVNEIFLPLVCGARLVVAPPGADGDVSALLALIAEHRVTFVYVVASMLEAMLEHPDLPAADRALRHVWCGGEALTPGLLARFQERTGAAMYHGYGPAEATIGVSCRVFGTEQGEITIGTPNPNARLYLLDRKLNPVPVGAIGELYIGGAPLARGYVNDPVRTAESFVPDPFGGRPGARLYRTGDLGRYRPDGLIEFLGRSDHQVKIGGRRVELGEIEAALTEHPGIRQAVVLLTDGQLIGCALVEPGASPDAADLRAWLLTRLPEYQVPRRYVVRAELPLTPAGKVDRNALTDLARRSATAATSFVAPRDDLERRLTEVWREVLAAERVGVRDNFFDLGGHSLLLVKAQTAYRRALGREVPMSTLLTHPTIESLAQALIGAADPVPAAAAGSDRRRKAAARQAELRRRAARTTGEAK